MSFPGTAIRPAGHADLKAVADIYTHYVRHSVITFDETPRSAADWEQLLGDLTARGLPFLVAELSGEVVGFAYAAPWRPKPAYRYTVEDTIYLAPDATGQGLGSALLGRLIAEAGRAGKRTMIAVIADTGGDDTGSDGTGSAGTGSDASTALHRRFGFTDAGRLTAVGHKHGRWVDTALLQRPLSAQEPAREPG
ncbi:GNAT family toxin-antitoxin system, toxin component [Streptomyces himastatinicus ATCC 53653]|uniref:GNAT family toxin-antitoxin system, toxin component n=1 Tax=Streptomyces himastatinicus ATCC 53653 TaxID=457427 RepID=D9WA37_9ACTN|nr:GNAT family N-acetyltransferase [Streptomyces himastatinicus]EFL24833.1 GNAT family toxin-antitoxin system, toxin component [Streptomyces himastatinicus ATCC 53653]